MSAHYLFSIDLEDVRDGLADPENYKDRVTPTTEKYLQFLDRHSIKCTFFIVGKIAQRKGDLIKRIVNAGHEIACHSYAHIPLDKLAADAKRAKAAFFEDLNRNLEALYKAGANNIIGFRAPIFSLVESTAWAYEVLEQLQFRYSSSVLPAKNPLYGWPNFGTKRKIGSIIELPQTLSPLSWMQVPFGGGIYFRILPAWLLKRWFKYFQDRGQDVTGYFHPYDVDTEQERFMHPGIKDSKFYNYLMYYGRSSVFSKLELILNLGFKICTYQDYLKAELAVKDRQNRSTLSANSPL